MRLIDADVAMEYINRSINEMTKIGLAVDADYLWALINYAIDNAPTVDAVPVVRCKDCDFHGEFDEAGWCICKNSGIGVRKDDYCSYGERRTDD